MGYLSLDNCFICRYAAGREGMGAGLTVRARAGRPEDDYEGDDWEGSYGRGEYGRRRGRRESPPHGRSRRHRCFIPAIFNQDTLALLAYALGIVCLLGVQYLKMVPRR